ncbi:MarR family winged helix-turn-helix transcriptional regulator [Desulfotruncus alcoholivorax]|uniref:MarR family winged helix-turn-helix transcriptional regulator n=1 Tax=Desulfotruncus alcoholivorax TaxID=265477 RepID=UPI00042632A1|nr:MarR family transcriptional regulator [Desulfotruncus alcoholivorax]
MSKKPEGPSKYICFKLSRVMRKIQRYYESSLNSFGITPVQFYVLSALWVNDGVKFKDLAKSLDMDGSTLTGILDRLERMDYVERRDDPEDRRSLLIFLKEKAKVRQQEIIGLAEQLNLEIKKDFSDQEFDIFERVLDRLIKEK